MIIGIGNDLVDIRRIEKALSRHGERFVERCFTNEERAKAESRTKGGLQTHTYAKRFAAKEACAKALGTGMAKGVHFKDIGVYNDAAGVPRLKLSGGAKKRLHALMPAGAQPHIHLSFTDEPPYAQAFVVIEARIG